MYIINKYEIKNVNVSKYFNKFTLVIQYYYYNCILLYVNG